MLSASDGKHAAADAAFRRAVQEKARLVTSDLVLAEVHVILLRRAGIRPARVALERISTAGAARTVFTDADVDIAARHWLDRFADRAISYADAVSFAFIEALRLDFALTFDGDFEVAGFRLWSA